MCALFRAEVPLSYCVIVVDFGSQCDWLAPAGPLRCVKSEIIGLQCGYAGSHVGPSREIVAGPHRGPHGIPCGCLRVLAGACGEAGRKALMGNDKVNECEGFRKVPGYLAKVDVAS